MSTITTNLIAEITSQIGSIEDNASLYNTENFNGRANAIDFIDFHIIDRLDLFLHTNELNLLKQWASRVKRDLESIDKILFEKLKKGVRSGLYAGQSLIGMINKFTGFNVDNNKSSQPGYDNLDIFINSLLTDQCAPEAIETLKENMVSYQQTPARIIFELAALAKLKPGDIFVDIGSGLGQVAMLVNLVSGVITKGIEYEPAYCDYAKLCATELNLSHVEFINTDARKAHYTGATVFFMYTPFKGRMLNDMLARLQKEAQKRIIRVYTYGPCSEVVSRQNWLNYLNCSVNDDYKLYEFWSSKT